MADRRARAESLLRRILPAPVVQSVPPGRVVELPGRGSTLVTDVPGPPGAPVVVLLHALGCTGVMSWYPHLDRLAETYRVITFDQRWHGRGISSARFSLRDCADDVVALLDVLEIDRAVITGYSLGGAVAQLVWRRHPRRVAALVLCATARNFRGARREQLFFPVVATFVKPLATLSHGRVVRYAASLAAPSVASSEPGWGLREFRSTSAWSTPSVLSALGQFNAAPWIGGVDVPTAVVVMQRDRAIPARRQRRLAACIEDAEVFEVDSGHAGMVLGAERFAPALDAALGSVVRRT